MQDFTRWRFYLVARVVARCRQMADSPRRWVGLGPLARHGFRLMLSTLSSPWATLFLSNLVKPNDILSGRECPIRPILSVILKLGGCIHPERFAQANRVLGSLTTRCLFSVGTGASPVLRARARTRVSAPHKTSVLEVVTPGLPKAGRPGYPCLAGDHISLADKSVRATQEVRQAVTQLTEHFSKVPFSGNHFQ